MSDEVKEVEKVVGRAIRAKYQPVFTNATLRGLAASLYYILPFIKKVRNSKEPGVMTYVGDDKLNDLERLRISWAALTDDNTLKLSCANPMIKLDKEGISIIAKAVKQHNNKKAKSVKLVAEVV